MYRITAYVRSSLTARRTSDHSSAVRDTPLASRILCKTSKMRMIRQGNSIWVPFFAKNGTLFLHNYRIDIQSVTKSGICNFVGRIRCMGPFCLDFQDGFSA